MSGARHFSCLVLCSRLLLLFASLCLPLTTAAYSWSSPPPTCDPYLHSLTSLFIDCPALLNSSLSHLPLYGEVFHVTLPTALYLIRSTTPPPPPPPTFSSLPFLPYPSPPSPSLSNWTLLLVYSPSEPFSLHLLPLFHGLAYSFPHLRCLALDWSQVDPSLAPLTAFNATTVVPSLLSPSAPSPPTPSLLSLLRDPLSLAHWWSAPPPPPRAEWQPPALSVTSPYVLRAVPSLLAFHSGAMVQPLHRWPRGWEGLKAHVALVTGMEAGPLPEEGGGEEEGEEEEGEQVVEEGGEEGYGEEREEADWEVLYAVGAEVDVGLVCSVVAMTAVHWLHRWRDRLEVWELARPHAGI